MWWLHHQDICWVVKVCIHNCGRAVHCDRAVTCGRAVPCCRAVPCGWAVACSRAVPCGRAFACGRAMICGRVVACDHAVARCQPSHVAEPALAAGLAPAEPSATGAGTGTAGADSIWICRAGEATTVFVRFSGALDFAGDSWTFRLATNVPPVLSERSRRLSRWLGWDLRSGDARDEDDERDRQSPEEWCWWWREKELDGRVSDAFETLPDLACLRELAPPEELGRARSLSLRSLLWPSRRDDWCLGDSWRFSSPCLRLRSGVLDLRWSDPWELGRSTAVTLEATDLGCDELVTVFDRLALDESSGLVRLVGKVSLGACYSTESSTISVSFLAAFAAAAALRRFLCAVALACAVQASGSQSWDRDCLECREANHRSNDTGDSGGGFHSCVGNGSTQETLAAIRLTTTCHVIFPPFSLAGTACQRRKHSFKTRNLLDQKTQPETNWRVF